MNRTNNAHNITRTTGWLGVLVIFTILISACQSTPTPTQPPALPTAQPTEPAITEQPTEEALPVVDLAPQLVDKQWLLVGYGDASNPTVVQEGTVVTAVFGMDGNLSGSGGCNNFSTNYELAGEMLTVGEIASTMMFCDKGMDQETAVLAALRGAKSIAFSPEGRLEILYDVGTGKEEKLVFTPGETSLVETVWVLESMGTPENPTNVESGTVVTAIFTEDGQISGTSSCNNYAGGYTAQDGKMQIQQPVSTMRFCTQGMEQEAAYLAAISAAESYLITGSRLEITYDKGAGILVYTSRNLTLENTLWTLTMMNGEPNTIGLVATTALFDPGEEPMKGAVGGVAMCNNYRGGYELKEDGLTVGEIITTMISCPETTMQAEKSYLEILGTAQSYQVLGQTLIVTAEKGSLIYVANRAPLEGTYWRLNSLGDVNNPQAIVDGGDFTAVFTRLSEAPSGLLRGGTGCNDYNAVFAANLNEIKVNMPGRTNNAGCSPALTSQEMDYFAALNAATTFRILGDNLQIPYGDGKMLNFTAFVPELPAEPVGPLSVLNGTRWWLIAMGNAGLLAGTEITAQFEINADGLTGAINGSGGCNTYRASITGAFTTAPATSTKMFCGEPVGAMEQETAYLARLATANSFSLAFNQLLIGTSDGLLVYYNAPGAVQPIEPSPTEPVELPATPTPEPGPSETVTPEPETPEPTEEPGTAQPPTAVITAPAEGAPDLAITFYAGSSTAEAGISKYQWNFGDGKSAEGVQVEHAFSDPGTYTVTLTVVDLNGKTGMVSVTITIS